MRLAMTARICAEEGCGTRLSAYNEDERCALHFVPEAEAEPKIRRVRLCADESCFQAARKDSFFCDRHLEALKMETETQTTQANGNEPRYGAKPCVQCGNDFQPSGPRAKFCRGCAAERKRASDRSRYERNPGTQTRRAKASPPSDDPRQRYLGVLLSRAEADPTCDDALLDRIERMLDVA